VTRFLAALCAIALASSARAEPAVMRVATIAPDGTAYARELRALARDVERETRGEVRFKLYFGAIAGDELSVIERINKGQLDGQVGSFFCDRLAPSLRVMHLFGLFQSREEEAYLLGRLAPPIEQELQAHGFVGLGISSGFGETVFFSRTPMRSLADLRRGRFWIWDLDDVGRMQLDDLGVPVVPTAVEAAARAYDERRADGFLAIPSGALAYQWSAQVRYFSDLRVGFLPVCVVITPRAFDALTLEQQRALRDAAARMIAHFDEVGRAEDRQLVGGLFQRQGLQSVPASPAFRAEFLAAVRAGEARLGARLIAPALLARVHGWLDEYRAQHGERGAR
jgi:TRAP-type C4-dicarboxylate transport system substrate-binding protein